MEISIALDKEGYLVNPEDWNKEVANQLALSESISINDEHWTVLDFIREYFSVHGIVPDIRHTVSHLVELHDSEKKAAKKYLFKLFPYGYVKQACKLAGMRRPRAWSTG